MSNEWRPIAGYEGYYEVSDDGIIKSVDRYVDGARGKQFVCGKIKKLFYDKGGYFRVALRKNGIQKKYLVHRLVAEAFIPNPENLSQINHKDENKENNRVENLEWCTAKYNINYGTHNKKVSDYKTEWWKDEDRRKCMSESKKGENNPNFGRKYTNEEIEKRVKHLRKKVYKYTVDGKFLAEYDSVKEAAEENGFDSSCLSRACRGKIRYGYKWSYEKL